MNKIRLKTKEKVRHFIIWLIVIIYICIIDSSAITNDIINVISTIISVFLGIMVPYYLFSLLIFPKLWKKNNLRLVFWLIIIFMYYFSYYWIEVEYIIPQIANQEIFSGISVWGFLLDAAFLYLVILGFAFSFFINKKQIYEFKKQLKKEKTLTVKEFHFLKGQLNSHTTFNFLNYYYSLIQKKSLKGARGIELFSDMLRFTSSIKSEQKVALNNEVDYIRNFIELKKLLSSSMQINFSCDSITPNNYKIAPRILITFIENAIKHGVSNEPSKPIQIKIVIRENNLKLNVKNTINTNKNKLKSSGIGIKNVKEQLNLIYPGKHEFRINNTISNYEVNLKLNLN